MLAILKKNSSLYLLLIYILLASIFLIHYLFAGQAVYGDGVGYYAYLHSWYFDFDNDFTNEYQHIYNYENNNALISQTSAKVQIVGTNQHGKALNHFSPGMAILLMPFYVLADGVVITLNFFGLALARNGYSNIYQIITGMGAITYVILAILFSDKLLKLFNVKLMTRRFATFLILFATNLLYYGSFDVLNSHFASFFLLTLFFLYFFKHSKNLGIIHYFWLGVTAGLVTITRPQDGIIAVVVLADILRSLKINKLQWRHFFKNLLAFFAPLILLIIPLIIQWQTTFDSFQSHPYFIWLVHNKNHHFIYNLIGTLFHHSNGLLTRTPMIFICALFFLYLFYKKKLDYSLKLFFLFFSIQYFIIALQGGWQAAAYGGRMYISSLPFFLLLIAKLIDWFENHYANHVKWLLVGLLISINILSIVSFVLFEKEASNNQRGTEIYTLKRIIKLIE